MAKNPVCMTERGERICAEIGSLKTGRSSSIDVQGILEMFVQRVKKSVREALGLLVEFNKCYIQLTHRKKRIVTRQSGYIDCLKVNSAAVVLSSSLTFSERFLRKAILKPKALDSI
jgi:hypothetical protein